MKYLEKQKLLTYTQIMKQSKVVLKHAIKIKSLKF